MPRIRRWFPVSHDINGDPEVWEFTERFGDRAFRLWMEILSITDKTEGVLRGSREQVVGLLRRRGRVTASTCSAAVRWMVEKRWLVHQPAAEGQSETLVVRNHSEYHRSKEPKKSLEETIEAPLLPTRPSELPKQTQKVPSADPAQPAGSAPPTPDNGFDPDTRNWLLATKHLKPLAEDQHTDFWSLLVKAYDRYPWLYFEEQIGKADAWIESNLSRAPTPRGLRRFMQSWMEKAVEIGRKQHG